MSLTANQQAIVKLYLVAFNRAPELEGLAYWTARMNDGVSIQEIAKSVFSLYDVQLMYPPWASADSFLLKIYQNVFGRYPDDAGLRYWSDRLAAGADRGALLMDIFNAGMAAPAGTAGQAYVENRYTVAQFAVEDQLASGVSLTPAQLTTMISKVNANPASVAAGKTEIHEVIAPPPTTPEKPQEAQATQIAPADEANALATRSGITLDAIDNGWNGTASQFDRALSAGLRFHGSDALSITGITNEAAALTSYTLSSLGGSTITLSAADGNWRMSSASYNAALGAGIRFAASDTVSLTDAQIQPPDEANALATRSNMTLDAIDNSWSASAAEFDRALNAGIKLHDSDGITVTGITDESAALTNYTVARMGGSRVTLAAADRGWQLTTAAYNAAVAAGISFASTDTLTVYDPPVQNNTIAPADEANALATRTNATLDATDNTWSATAAVFTTALAAGLKFDAGDAITVTAIANANETAALTAYTKALMGGSGVTLDAADDAWQVTATAFNALGTAGSSTHSGDTVTVADTAANLGSLSTTVTSAAKLVAKITNAATLTLTAPYATNTFDLSTTSAQTLNLNSGYTGATTVSLSGDGGGHDTVSNAANIALTVSGNVLDFNATTITGGSGTDILQLTANNDSASLANVTNVETVTILANAGDATKTATLTGLTTAATKTVAVNASALTNAAAAFSFTAGTDAGHFSVTGGAGNDTLVAGAGGDTLIGAAGDDSITGGSGADSISGGAGNDFIRTTAGADTIDGGADTDTLRVQAGAADLSIYSLGNFEVLDMGSQATTLGINQFGSFSSFSNTSGGVTFIDVGTIVAASSGLAKYTLGGGVNTFTADGAQNYNVSGAAGGAGATQTFNFASANFDSSDTVVGGSATTDVLNITGNTALTGFALDGVNKVENIVFSQTTASVSLNRSGSSALTSTSGMVTLDATAMTTGNFTFTDNASTSQSFKILLNGSGNGTITISGNESVSIVGGAGNDSFTTNAGTDTLIGGTGNDTIRAGVGTDIINISSGGNDVVRLALSEAGDTVSGFTAGAGADRDVFDWNGQLVSDAGSVLSLAGFGGTSSITAANVLELDAASSSGAFITVANATGYAGGTSAVLLVNSAVATISGNTTTAFRNVFGNGGSHGLVTASSDASQFLVIVYNGTTASANACVFYVDYSASTDSDSNLSSADTVTLLAVLNGVGADTLTATNFL